MKCLVDITVDLGTVKHTNQWVSILRFAHFSAPPPAYDNFPFFNNVDIVFAVPLLNVGLCVLVLFRLDTLG